MLKRFGISLEEELLKKFDKLIAVEGYTNRSEAIRDMIRATLVRKEWNEGNKETAGVVTLVYDHHQFELAQKMTDIQHKDFEIVISSLHIHVDKKNCLEVILLKGKSREIKRVADTLISTKGVKHGRFIFTTTGKDL